MAVLNLARAHPGLFFALCRHLDQLGKSQDRNELYARFVPGSLDRGPDKAPAISFNNTITLGQRTGVLAITTSGVGIAEPESGKWRGIDREGARQQMLDRLLDIDVAGADPFSSDEDAPAADFARLATWFVRVDPTGPVVLHRASAPGHPRRLMDEMGGNPDWVPGDPAGWDMFHRWAVALGFARERPTTSQADQSLGLVPDTYPVLSGRLGLLSIDKVQTLESALKALSTVIPLVPTGRLDEAWIRYTGASVERAVIPSVSFALFRLAEEGRLDLLPSGDGVPYALRFGEYADVPSPYGARSAEVRRYSNVKILGGAS